MPVILLALALLLAGLLVARHWLRPAPPAAQAPPEPGRNEPLDPRLTYAGPYENVRPNVTYVGDKVCAGCHPSHARSYHHHSMGRSLAPVANALPVERYDAGAKNPFTAGGFEYEVVRKGSGVFHRETSRDGNGKVLTQIEAEVLYAVGSGAHGRSYLINRGGYLFQSPITWYPQKGMWDLSPTYDRLNHHFGRPILADCLFCHANHAEEAKRTLNRYLPPIFRGYAIGCERCHGPGELHVKAREGMEPIADHDVTIVNPARLEASPREAVCAQCHLQGQLRVLRRGRDTFDYRPGLALEAFQSVFVKSAAAAGDLQFVGHVEQMHASRCFQAGQGRLRLGCVSCHDPHELPPPEKKTAFYRERCLRCHAPRGCSLPLEARKPSEDSCMECHMPRTGSDIRHASIHDHRIPRKGNAEAPPLRPGLATRPVIGPLAYFHENGADIEDAEIRRDFGIALMDASERVPDEVRRKLGQLALPLLDGAVKRDREDVPALHARGQALWAAGHLGEAALTFDEVLGRSPGRERTLDDAANLAMARNRPDQAVRYWEQAVEVDPFRWQHYYALGAAHSRLQHWRTAIHRARQALELNPADVETRMVVVQSLVALGEKEQAKKELEIVLALDPARREVIRRLLDGR